MKVCLYLEYYHFLGGRLYKNVGTGLLSSYKNQKSILQNLRLPFTERWDTSCDILQINTPWLNSLRLIKKAKAQNIPVIIWAHVTAEDIKGVFRFSAFLAPLAKKYLTYAYGLADVVFCPSAYTKSLLHAYGIPDEQLVVQSNAVDTDFFKRDERKRKAIRKERNITGIMIGTVALSIPRKGLTTFCILVRAFADNTFYWFGKIYSPLIAQSLPPDLPSNAIFTGYVQDIIAAFNAIDIFLFPSYEENQGMVLLEAAALGLPLLVRDIPVYEGWLIHGQNCLKAKDDQEFSRYLGDLMNDASLRERLGDSARKLAHEHSIHTLSQKTLRIYERLCSRRVIQD